MASLYADENFPLQVVEALRRLGHDVLTCLEAGHPTYALTLGVALPRAGRGRPAMVHSRCNELLRLVAKVGPLILGRVRAYLWPTQSDRERDGKAG